jgi:Fe-Mn family superoxide dismutase
MKKFEEKKFTIPELKGISKKTIEEHIKLYSGYVKNANLIFEKIGELIQMPGSAEKNAYAISEMQRRFGFEFDGMRNHEVYFSSLEGGPKPLSAGGSESDSSSESGTGSTLKAAISAEGGTFEDWLVYFKMIAMTRGIGWAMLYYDRTSKRLLTTWVDEQHMGQLQDCALILGLDMWEHSYVADYQPSGKKHYVEDFFANVNWEVIEKNFLNAEQ